MCKSLLLQWAFFLITTSAVSALALESSAADSPERFVYRVTLLTNKNSETVYKTLVDAKAEFNEVSSETQNSSRAAFFNFYSSPQDLWQLADKLRTLGKLIVLKKVDYLQGPKDKVRVSLWTAPAPKTSELVAIRMLQAVTEPQLKKNKSARTNLADFGQQLLEHLADGPFAIRTDGVPDSPEPILIETKYVKRFIPVPAPVEGGWDLVVEIAPQHFYSLEDTVQFLSALPGLQISEVKKVDRFLSRGMYLENEMLVRLIQVFPHAMIELYPNSAKTNQGLRVLVKINLPDHALNTLLEKKTNENETVNPSYSATASLKPAEKAEEEPPPAPTSALERRPLKKFFEIHALGSSVSNGANTIFIADTYAQGFIESFGAKIQYINLFNAPSEVAVTSTSGSIQYRIPIRDETFRQTVIGSLHMRKIETPAVTADFYGYGISYTDHLWPALDSWLSRADIFSYPKTLEINIEHFPTSTKPSVEDVSAYAANLRTYMYITDQWTLEAGLYVHKFQFNIPKSAGMSNSTLFFEMGFGYRF